MQRFSNRSAYSGLCQPCRFPLSILATIWLFVIWLFIICLAAESANAKLTAENNRDEFSPQQLDFFENEVRPILVERCYECHADGESGGGLSLQSRKAMLVGGDTGPAIKPGDANNSLIIQAIRYDAEYEMPPDSKMPDDEIAALTKWVNDGAAWPTHSDVEIESATSFDIKARKESHWCWQPVKRPDLPAELKQDAVDFLVSERLAGNGLQANGKADRSSLLRRVSFDLTGLPPSTEHVQDYVLDQAVSLESIIDQLLDSPQFGERWARHWMDLSRYAETYGHEFDYPIENAWRYRDYLIRAFNLDVPYDQFVVEHLAGDLLDDPRRHPEHQFNESVLGTGFWFLGEATHAPVDAKEDEARRIDNQIDVMSRSFLGLTVACARCHDHKFDAISTKDYYALSGFLQSSRRQDVCVDFGLKSQNAAAESAKLQRRIGELSERLKSKLLDLAPEQIAKSLVAGLQAEDGASVKNTEAAFNAESERIEKSLRTLAKKLNSGSQNLNPAFKQANLELMFSGDAFDGDRDFPLVVGKSLQLMHSDVSSSASLGIPFSGTLRTSTFTIEHDFLHVRLKSKNAEVTVVVDGNIMHQFNALLFEGLHHKSVDHDEFKWLTLGRSLKNFKGHKAWLEIRDRGPGFFAVDEILFSNSATPPKFPKSAPANELPDLAAVDAEEIVSGLLDDVVIGARADDRKLTAFASWILQHQMEDYFDAHAIASDLRQCHESMLEIGKQVPSPAFAVAMIDGTPEDEYVFIRGNHKTKGELAHRQFLSAIAGSEDWRSYTDGVSSGRLQLARKIASPDNPLTARVMVNRIWHHLLGVGIVKSVDNFGVLGERPSHPELLDYLAAEFVADNWSIKRMIRRIMLTDTYQRSSRQNDPGRELDPDNIYLSRTNMRRLQGEAIRDSMLSVAGTLRQKMFGRSVRVHLTPFMKGRGRPRESGPLDGDGRRSIYVEVRRNFLSPMMLAFDTPIPFNAIGNRSNSNVPTQALILLNDPFVLQQAERFANRIIEEQAIDSGSRIEAVWLSALGRKPRKGELKQALAFVEKHARELGVSVQSPEVWRDFCHVVFNTKEFIFLN